MMELAINLFSFTAVVIMPCILAVRSRLDQSEDYGERTVFCPEWQQSEEA